jgi:UDPglucose 6-dehydrogenase
MDVAIMGAGYVGLVTAACLAHLGHDVTCLDVDPVRVSRLERGDLPIHEPGLDELVAEGLARGRLRFSADATAIRGCGLVIVCVGTLDADEEWSDTVVSQAVADIAADVEAPRHIVIRSTLLPGAAVAIAARARGLDRHVVVAHNPEFTREATAVSDFLSPDRIVIGVDDQAEGAGAAALVEDLRRVYAALDAPVVVTDLTSAETIKMASNVFLATKITFANELARLCAVTGADVAAVVDGMGMDARIVRSFLSPGPGFGGSCFPSQARALPELARRHGVDVPLMEAVWPSNTRQVEWLVDSLERTAGRSLSGMHVALLGLTFKAGTDDLRESPALRLGVALLARGAHVVAWDPAAVAAGVARLAQRSSRPRVADGPASEAVSAVPAAVPVRAAASVEDACAGADAVVVATEWPEFALLDWSRIARTMRGDVVLDARRIVDADLAREAGLRVVSLGVAERRPPVPSA